uniref:One cut domain family member 3 n=1 Tax=Elaeis guineensis var. tenera TaxID=51953 RepID=A0A6J0PJW3_ELAGV|nr:one cut domain family member 3 [Elaeis guineensis]
MNCIVPQAHQNGRHLYGGPPPRTTPDPTSAPPPPSSETLILTLNRSSRTIIPSPPLIWGPYGRRAWTPMLRTAAATMATLLPPPPPPPPAGVDLTSYFYGGGKGEAQVYSVRQYGLNNLNYGAALGRSSDGSDPSSLQPGETQDPDQQSGIRGI